MRLTIMNKIALDTNVLIYLLDDDEASFKRKKANQLIAASPFISPQVISEYLNVCHRKLKMTKDDLLFSLLAWLLHCQLCLIESEVYVDLLRLVKKYKFQMFDAIIISSALRSDCSVLYSEDMQHNLIVDKKLKIINLFV